MRTAPVIIIGMHRSGTTMLTKMLDQAGFFPGNKLDVDHEAYFFLQLNKYIFNQAGITWDNLYNYQFCNEFFIKNVQKFLERHLASNRRVVFLGLNKYLRYGSVLDIDFPWCWKDPRTSVTLNIWKRIFPTSKIIFIHRNPIDVALSLKRREEKLQSSFRLDLEKRLKENILYHNFVYSHSLRVAKLQEGIKLWEEYNQYALNYRDQYRKDFHTVCYEDLLKDPEDTFNDVLHFLGHTISEEVFAKVIGALKKERRFSFLSDDAHVELYESLKSNRVFCELGYDKQSVLH